MAQLRQDLSYTIRRLSKTPGLVLAVVISIGLGLAANATIFSMVSRFVLTPPPVGDPGTLMTLKITEKDGGTNSFSWPIYTDLRDQAKSFSGLAAYNELVPASIGGKGEPERLWGQAATANFFDVAQLRMTLGRGFLPSEERQQVIVLGYRVWQRRFASDPAIIGQSVTIYRDEVRARIDALTNYFLSHGVSDHAAAQHQALVAIGATIRRQALVMSFSDAFAVIGVLLAIAAVAVLFAKKANAGAASSGGH